MTVYYGNVSSSGRISRTVQKLAEPNDVKRCARCRRVLPETEFYTDSNALGGRDSVCKNCRRASRR